MDSLHRNTFAALSVLNLNENSWTCQAIDGIKNNNKWDAINEYKHTDALAAIENFNGPYTMTFDVKDGSSTLTLTATVYLDGRPAKLTDGSGKELSLPSNNKPQIDPGIDINGSQVWFRFQQDDKLRELRFHTPLNIAAVEHILKDIAEWLIKRLPTNH